MKRSSSQRLHQARSGYTLLEVLLALGLSGLLMLLVYNAMQIYWQVNTLGRVDAERGQLARTLIRRMEMDIRSVTFKAAQDDQAGGSDDQAAEEGAGNTQDGEAAASATTAAMEGTYLVADVHLIGTASSLELIALRPTRNRTGNSEDALFADVESDRRRVGYMFSAAGSDGGGGLYYRNADQQIERMMESEGTAVDPSTQYQLLAPEIAYLEFQYLDGSTSAWVSEWHSHELGGLPRAIKITFQFHPVETASTNRVRTSRTSASTEVFQTVVHIPVSEAPVEL